MSDLTPDSNPGMRAGDNGFKGHLKNWWGPGRGYRDVVLCIILGLFIWSLIADRNQDKATQTQRVDATVISCTKSNENTDAINAEFSALQGLVLAGAALPGDTPGPVGVKDPAEWDTIKAGPLSKQLAEQFPGFPDAQERLTQAKESARKLEDKKVTRRDCAAEVDSLRERIRTETGIDVPRPPIPTPTSSPEG